MKEYLILEYRPDENGNDVMMLHNRNIYTSKGHALRVIDEDTEAAEKDIFTKTVPELVIYELERIEG